MPYYQWRGVDLEAHIQKGYLFAQSIEHLATLLLKKEIYLLHAQPKYHRFVFTIIFHYDVTSFFQNLATLLDAKIHLTDALPLVIDQCDNPRFQNILYAITDKVQSGIPFYKAIENYPTIFNTLTMQLLEIGEDSGTLNISCETIVQYMHEQSTLYNKIKSALFLPIITFTSFVVITLIIFTTLVPRFATTFSALKVPLSQSTQTLFYISSLITVQSIVVLLCCILLIIVLWYKASQTDRYNHSMLQIILHLPFVGPLVRYRFCAAFFQSLFILINNNIPLNKAVMFLTRSEKNNFFKKEIEQIHKAIDAGIALHVALSRSEFSIFNNTSIAMTAIGEESANLAFMLKKITFFYNKIIERRLYILTTLIQPLLMIILGLCIACLITALYIPLFNMSLSLGNQ